MPGNNLSMNLTIKWDASMERCAAQHFGFWCIEPTWFSQAVSAIRAGEWEPRIQAVSQPAAREYYATDANGVAVVPIIGQITKGESSYGGTSSVRTRRALQLAQQDNRVKAIFMPIDSPGGTVAGTSELARAVSASEKPIFAHIEDLGASAAYWVASQADRITADSTAEVGSIGTMAVVQDFSGKAAMEGVKVHVISTGARKGDFVPGTEIKPEQLEQLQNRVNDLNQFFLEAVADGRGQPMATVEEWATGEVWIAEKAKERGLIDSVSTLEQSMGELRALVRPKRTARASIVQAQIDLLK